MAIGFFKEEGMEPKPRSSLQRKPISEDQIRRAIALGDEMCGREIVKLVSSLSDDARRKIVLALFAQELKEAKLPPAVSLLHELAPRNGPRPRLGARRSATK